MPYPCVALRQYALFIQISHRKVRCAKDVRHALGNGEELEAYPEDHPYPSRVVLGWLGSRPLHIVVAQNPPDDEIIIITIYEPNPFLWDASFRRRRR